MKALTSLVALATAQRLENTVASEKQSKIMLVDYIESQEEIGGIDTDFRLIYEWWTEREFYSGGIDKSFLYSTFTLENLQTKLL